MSYRRIKHELDFIEMDLKAISIGNNLTPLDKHRVDLDLPRAIAELRELTKPWWMKLAEAANKWVDAFIEDTLLNDGK